MKSEVVYEPHDHDVKGGKGHGSNMHPGNRFYQAKVKEMKPLYAKTESNFEKSLIATEIVNSVQQRDPPGRFLEQTGKNQPWVVLPHDKIMKKVKQALRDKPISSKEKAGGAQTGTSTSNLPTRASQKPTHSTEAAVLGIQSSCPKEDTTMPPMPPLSTENDILGSLGNDIQTETIRSSMADSLRTSQLFAIQPEHTSPQEYRHISVDQIDMNGNIPSNNSQVHRNNLFYASEGQVQYSNDCALSAYTSSKNSTIPNEHSQLQHSLPQDQPNYQNSEAPFRHSMPAQYEIEKDQSDQIDPRGHEEMNMSLSPFASADLNGIVNMLQDEMGNQSNSDGNEYNSGAAEIHPQNSVSGQQLTNVPSQANPSVMNYNDISLEDDFNKSDLNKIIDCLQEESPQKRRNMSVQDHVPYQQAQYDRPELPAQSNHRRPTLLNFQVQRNSSTQVVQEEFKEPNPMTNHNQFTGLPSPSNLDSTDDASITLDDLQGEAPKNIMSQSVPNYVSSSNTTQKYPHALDLRHSHNSHNRPLHTSTIQIKPDEGNETMANTSMAFSDSSLSVGDLLAKDGSSPGCPDVAQGNENEEEPLQGNDIQNEGALSDGGKDATMDFDNTKNTDFWGSVMSQMEFSFQNVMNFVSGKDGKGDRDH